MINNSKALCNTGVLFFVDLKFMLDNTTQPWYFLNMTDMAHITAARLRALREKKGWTVKDLAMATNISVRSINRYENGQISPTLSTLTRILEVCGMSSKEFFSMDTAGRTTGGRLRARRRAKGWTIKDLAEATGIDPSLLCRYEQDRCAPKLSTLTRILGVWGISPQTFFDDAPTSAPSCGRNP